jgi:hypothetical protein
MSFKKSLFAFSIISTFLSSDVFAGRSVRFHPDVPARELNKSLGKTVTKAIPIATNVTSTEEKISTPPVQHKFTGKSKLQPFKSDLPYQKPIPEKFNKSIGKTVTKAIPIASVE